MNKHDFKSKQRNLRKFKKSVKGITLIALVVTIIVLLILAAVAINLTIGNNGIFTRAQDATEKWDEATVTEDFNLILGEYPLYKLDGGKDSLENYLLNKGADSVTDNGDGTLEVEYKDYIFTVDKDTTEIKDVEKAGGVKPEIEVSKQVSGVKKTVTITVKVTNNVGTVDSIELYGPDNNQVTGNVDLSSKTATFTANSNGTYTAKVKATTDGKQRSGSSSIEVNEILVEFSTAFGRIEVVWIDNSNNIINEPLAPVLNGMTPVKWNGTTEETTTEEDSDWYNYVAGTGTADNLNSHWANAKDANGSYFVWIPRYAYRITYYASQDSTAPTGYYDGRGMVDTQGNVKNNCTLEEGIETVEKNGKSYIVHPAFMDDTESSFSHGGWDSDLSGLWIGKYEASRSNATSESEGSGTTIKIQPNVQSWRYISISNCYTYSKEYNTSLESHLMKNSEWGAVAYLTHSQYGRNGNEIDINNSSSYITGNGGGSTNAGGASGVTNAYDTEEGQKASSTGNIYGIYDLSGGAYEYVAAFDKESSSSYLTNTSYGGKMTAEAKDEEVNYISTKYITAYTNGTSISSGEKVYEVGKTGDATKEVNVGAGDYNWFSDTGYFLSSSNPFFKRGGYYYRGSSVGVFSSYSDDGSNDYAYGFRVALPGATL